MFNKPGPIILLAAILIAIISIYTSSSAPSVNPSPGDKNFSVPAANQYLEQIARAPHSTGTVENLRVRNFIEATCRQLGLTTEIQHTTGMIHFGRAIAAGNVYNIIARIKGQQSTKAILIAAHYDSQPNALGAGDDGAGCAAMLETAHLLTSGSPLKNDVIFLFTDGEEGGLLGACGFVREDSLLKDVGLVINFEGRGNAGVSTMFETNPDNGWVIREYARSAAHPNASSLSYEIYKTLPNNTDYSVFKDSGIAGLNNAYIEGYVNYHSMTDNPANLDKGSFQDHGDNMLSLVRHFGNLDLRNTKAPDITYFDIIGEWLVYYPASLDLFFLVLGNLLLIGYFVMGFVRRKIAVKGLIGGVIIFPLVLVLLFFVNIFFFKAIRAAYPLNDNFYSYNAYNAHYYFFAAATLSIAVFTLIYQWLLRKKVFNTPSLLGGILLIGVIAMDLMYTVAPTAIFVLSFPLIFLMIAWLIFFIKGIDDTGRPWLTGIILFVSLLPAILLLAPTIDGTFTAFGLTGGSASAIIFLGLLLGLLLPVFALVFKTDRMLLPGLAFVCWLIALGAGHLHSRFTTKAPMKTNVRYLLDADQGKAYWVSEFLRPDYWNKQFFPNGKVGVPVGDLDRGLINDAPVSDLKASDLVIQKDTLIQGIRWLDLHCRPEREGVISARFIFDKAIPATQMVIDGRPFILEKNSKQQSFRELDYQGVAAEGFDIRLGVDPKSAFGLYLFDRSLGLPQITGFPDTYPNGVIPGTDWNSNTVQVVKHYMF